MARPSYVRAILSRLQRLARREDTKSAQAAQRPANAPNLRSAPGTHMVLTTRRP